MSYMALLSVEFSWPGLLHSTVHDLSMKPMSDSVANGAVTLRATERIP